MKIKLNAKQGISIVFILTVILIVLVIRYISLNEDFSFFVYTVDGYSDISGWATLVVSTGIGIAIAISILIYSSSQQNKMNEIILEQQTIRKSREKFIMKKLYVDLQLLQQRLRGVGGLYLSESKVLAQDKTNLEQMIKFYELHLSMQLNNTLTATYEFSDAIPDDIFANVISICEPLQKYYKIAETGQIARLQIHEHVEAIESVLRKLEGSLPK